MKKILQFIAVIGVVSANSQTVFINEIHYDNAGADLNEFVEIAGTAGVDLSLYTLEFYTGSTGKWYKTSALSGVLTNIECGYGVASFSIADIQNGNAANDEPDGIALVKDGTTVVQFISYEGSFTAVDKTAMGLTSTNISVNEDASATLETESLQLIGSGTIDSDFTWIAPSTATPGSINTNQNFSCLIGVSDNELLDVTIYPNPSADGHLNIKNNNGQTVYVYNVLGELIIRTNENKVELDKGIYIFKIGELTRRVIVK